MAELPKRARKPDTEQFLRMLHELPVYSPTELYDELTRIGYRGQVTACKAMCLWAYRHVARIRRIYLQGALRESLPSKANTLLLGPTGSGKTYLVELLFGHILRIPTVIVDVTGFSETGYVGQDANSVLTRLLHAADDNVLWAQIGVICLDEFDKLSSGQNNAVFAGAGTTKDVSGLGVQRELLKMLESAQLVIARELGHSTYGDHLSLSTQDIGFVACGAFSGLADLLKSKRGSQLGFGSGQSNDHLDFADSFLQKQISDVSLFEQYGFLPELIARFSRIVALSELSAQELGEILQNTVIARTVQEFALEGLSLHIEPSAIAYVTDRAIAEKTGARGLSSVLSKELENIAFSSFGQGLTGVVRVTAENGALRSIPHFDGPAVPPDAT